MKSRHTLTKNLLLTLNPQQLLINHQSHPIVRLLPLMMNLKFHTNSLHMRSQPIMKRRLNTRHHPPQKLLPTGHRHHIIGHQLHTEGRQQKLRLIKNHQNLTDIQLYLIAYQLIRMTRQRHMVHLKKSLLMMLQNNRIANQKKNHFITQHLPLT